MTEDEIKELEVELNELWFLKEKLGWEAFGFISNLSREDRSWLIEQYLKRGK